MAKGRGGTKRRNGNARKKPSGSRRPLLALLLVVILIVLAIYLLELVRKEASSGPVAPPAASERLKMPERPGLPVVQPQVTTAAREHPTPPRRAKRAVGPGSVAIIIDDMGASVDEAERLLAINLPITFSVIPGLARSTAVAETAHRGGAEVMIHMPMEPKGYPQQRMEKNGLLVSEGDAEIARQVDSYMRSVPHAVGANNHMGSRSTENEEKMQVVLKELRTRGLFFIDSKTSPASVGYRVAKRLGLRAGSRQVFLDNVNDVAAIEAQLDQVAAVARKHGSAIAICHPHRLTIQALAIAMPRLKKEGITFVHASALVS